MGADKFLERHLIDTVAQTQDDRKAYTEAVAAPFYEPHELTSWSFYRAGIAEFMATFLLLFISILTILGVVQETNRCLIVGFEGIAWAFSGTIFVLVYCTFGISGNHPSLYVSLSFLCLMQYGDGGG